MVDQRKTCKTHRKSDKIAIFEDFPSKIRKKSGREFKIVGNSRNRSFPAGNSRNRKFPAGNSRNLKFQAGNVGILFEIGKKHVNKTTYSPATQVFRDLGDSIITYVLHYFEKRIIIPHQIPKDCHKQSLKSYIMPNTPKKRTFLFDKDQVFWQHA